jgi:hypothetical protein
MDLYQLAQKFNPFMDQNGEPFLQVTVEGENEPHQIALDSPMAGSLIRSELTQIVKNGIPTDHQTRTAIEVIRGVAYVRARAIAKYSVEHQISRKPLAQAVLAIARKGGTKKTLPALLAMFIRVAAREGLDMKKGPWPSNEDALGKQLSPLIPILAEKGVQLVRHVNERPRTWSISALVEGSDENDANVAIPNTTEVKISIKDVTSQPESKPRSEEDDSGPILSDEHLAGLLKGVIS